MARDYPRLEPGVLESRVVIGVFGEPGWDRTNDLLIKSQLLYH